MTSICIEHFPRHSHFPVSLSDDLIHAFRRFIFIDTFSDIHILYWWFKTSFSILFCLIIFSDILNFWFHSHIVYTCFQTFIFIDNFVRHSPVSFSLSYELTHWSFFTQTFLLSVFRLTFHILILIDFTHVFSHSLFIYCFLRHSSFLFSD